MLVERKTFLAVETFELGFSCCGLGDAELAMGPPKESKETEEGDMQR